MVKPVESVHPLQEVAQKTKTFGKTLSTLGLHREHELVTVRA